VEISDASKLTEALKGFPCDLEIDKHSITIKVKLVRPITEYSQICQGLVKTLTDEIEEVDDHQHVFEPYFTTDICTICGKTIEEIGDIKERNRVLRDIIRKLMK